MSKGLNIGLQNCQVEIAARGDRTRFNRQPSILLADEPTGNLDKRNSELVEKLLLELCRSHGVTMLLVTHDQELAQRLPYHVVMEDGKILELGGDW